MGKLVSKNVTNQVLVLGPEGAGKSTLLYTWKLNDSSVQVNQTQGFQYEEATIQSKNKEDVSCGFWDVGGGDACQLVLSQISQNVKFNGIIFVIDVTKELGSIHGGVPKQNEAAHAGDDKGKKQGGGQKAFSKIDQARRMLHRVMAADEMRFIHTLGIVLNVRQGSDLYLQIYDKNTRTSTFIRRLKEDGHINDNEDEDEPNFFKEGASRSNSRVKATRLSTYKKNNDSNIRDPFRIQRRDDSNKEQFIQRMVVSSEWLDMREILLGFSKKVKEDNPLHEHVIVDSFDVVEDEEARTKFFEKVILQCGSAPKIA